MEINSFRCSKGLTPLPDMGNGNGLKGLCCPPLPTFFDDGFPIWTTSSEAVKSGLSLVPNPPENRDIEETPLDPIKLVKGSCLALRAPWRPGRWSGWGMPGQRMRRKASG